MKEGCGHIFHGYCLFQMFGGCECEFTMKQMKSILGNRIGNAKIISKNNFGGCAMGCDKGRRERNAFYTYIRL